jgi:hypothetical protein
MLAWGEKKRAHRCPNYDYFLSEQIDPIGSRNARGSDCLSTISLLR